MTAGVDATGDDGGIAGQGFKLIPVQYVEVLFARKDVVELAGTSMDTDEGAAAAVGAAE